MVAMPVWAVFLVLPYVQNPAPDAMTVIWFTSAGEPGVLEVISPDDVRRQFTSQPEAMPQLDYHETEGKQHPGNQSIHRHRVRITDLQPGTLYDYTVTQQGQVHRGTFRTTPDRDTPIRFIAYADSETEPESTGKSRKWSQPGGSFDRRYILDQTAGYRENVRVMAEREPHFIAIAGDLVESGGEQRDWDEFWRHNAGELNTIASSVPLFPALGNHDVFAGPQQGGFQPEPLRWATEKYMAYFDLPSTGDAALDAQFPGQFYRVDYGPITLITLNTCNGEPNESDRDTNFYIGDEGYLADFNPGSPQYAWLDKQLADAQKTARFIFVQFHHAPYSVGPHGFPTGKRWQRHGEDNQSGLPVRVLTPLFLKYGVTAVFSGHDEMYERSEVSGTRIAPDGREHPHTVQFYDIGIGGDGLRGPYMGPTGRYDFDSFNPYQKFLAHLHAPEVWDGKRLVSGGKHYGHLEVNIAPNEDGHWQATLTPVHIFPVMNEAGEVVRFERRVYDDEVVVKSAQSAP